MLTHSQNLRGLFQVAGAWIPSHPSPESAERVMTCAFSLLQHIGAGARVNMWLPNCKIETSATPPTHLDWLAIRQVEVLQEGSNIELYDMEMENFKRTLKYFNAARARSQRLIVIVGGTYKKPHANQDDLKRFDDRFCDRLQNMINLLWLNEMKPVFNRITNNNAEDEWDIMRLLPHIGATFTALQIFQPATVHKSEQAQHFTLGHSFLETVKRMPRNAAREHSVIVGLKIPKLQPDHDINWGPASEFQRLPFMQALQAVFQPFGMDTPTIHHPRAHGDHMNNRKRENYTPLQEAYRASA